MGVSSIPPSTFFVLASLSFLRRPESIFITKIPQNLLFIQLLATYNFRVYYVYRLTDVEVSNHDSAEFKPYQLID